MCRYLYVNEIRVLRVKPNNNNSIIMLVAVTIIIDELLFDEEIVCIRRGATLTASDSFLLAGTSRRTTSSFLRRCDRCRPENPQRASELSFTLCITYAIYRRGRSSKQCELNMIPSPLLLCSA